MKVLKLVFVSALAIFSLASCSDDFGINAELVEVESLEASVGEEIDFSLKLEADSGISQIVVDSEALGIDYFENTENDPGGKLIELTAIVPADAETGDEYSIDVEVSDAAGNNQKEVFTLKVI